MINISLEAFLQLLGIFNHALIAVDLFVSYTDVFKIENRDK